MKDTETIARIRGVASQMASFDFFYGLVLGEMLLRHSDNLSRTIQKQHISAAEGQAVAEMTTSTLSKMRNDQTFALFWEKVTSMASEREVDDPSLPRQRKRPKRYEEGALAEFDSTPQDMYRKVCILKHLLRLCKPSMIALISQAIEYITAWKV